MYSVEACSHVMKKYGTYRVNDCRRCELHKNRCHRGSTNGFCSIAAYLELAEIDETCKTVGNTNKAAQSLVNKFKKLELLGFTIETGSMPWLVLRNSSGEVTWINIRNYKMGAKYYDRIELNGNIILCTKGDSIEAYSSLNSDKNLLEGLELRRFTYNTFPEHDIIAGYIIDPLSKVKVVALINNHGKRVGIVASEPKVRGTFGNIEVYDNSINISVLFDKNLDVIRRNKKSILLNL